MKYLIAFLTVCAWAPGTKCQTAHDSWLISAGAFRSFEGLDEGYFIEASSPSILTVQPSLLFSYRPNDPATLSAGLRLDKKIISVRSADISFSIKSSYFVRDDSYHYDQNFFKASGGAGVRIPFSTRLGMTAHFLPLGYYKGRNDRFVDKNAFPDLFEAGELSLAFYCKL
jgi:hypothetical protein